jgi:hypothetical protein
MHVLIKFCPRNFTFASTKLINKQSADIILSWKILGCISCSVCLIIKIAKFLELQVLHFVFDYTNHAFNQHVCICMIL